MKARTALGLVVLCAACGTSSHASPPATIVLDRSIGGIRLGEIRNAVQRALGSGALVSTQMVGTGSEPRVRVTKVLYAKLLVTYYGQRVGVVDTPDPRYRTANGVGVGSPWRDVLALTGTNSSLGGCAVYADLCQHGGDPANGGRLTVFFNGPGAKVSRVLVMFGH